MKNNSFLLVLSVFTLAVMGASQRHDEVPVAAKSADCSCSPCECVKCVCAATDDPLVTIEYSPAQEAAPMDVSQHLYRIRAYGYSPRREELYTNATCVSVGGGTFLTAAHLTENMTPGFIVEVYVDGGWKKASYRFLRHEDAAVAVVDGVDLPPLSLRSPDYMESLCVHGLQSNTDWRGVYSSPRTVSLERSATGTIQGDSGGAVFSADGTLVGIISGYLTDEKRVVTFAPVSAFDELLNRPTVAAARSDPVQLQQAPVQNCPDDVCYPTQQPQQQFQFVPRRKGFFRR